MIDPSAFQISQEIAYAEAFGEMLIIPNRPFETKYFGYIPDED